jgi:hypothetical protein
MKVLIGIYIVAADCKRIVDEVKRGRVSGGGR